MGWIRAVYAIEFLLAVLVAVFAWPMVAGQGHVDYVPWEWKLGLTVAFALCFTMSTGALVTGDRVRAVSWLLGLAVVMVGMGYQAYLAHLEEEETEGPDVFRSEMSNEDVFDHVARNAGEPRVQALEFHREPLVIDAQHVQHGGMEIVHAHRVLDRGVA